MTSLNQSVFYLIHHLAGQNVILDGMGIFFAEYLPYLMILAFLVMVYYQEGWRRKVYLFSEGALAVILARGLLTEIIRFFYHQERPFSFFNFTPLIREVGWSFPSGHAAWFFALGLVVWYANRKWGYWFFALSILMGIARIYVGVHWPIDIIGGIIVGIASGAVIHWSLKDSREKLYSGHSL